MAFVVERHDIYHVDNGAYQRRMHVVGHRQGGSIVWCRGGIEGRPGKDYVDLCHEGGPTIDCNDGF
jgi:hypothetical protein